MKNDPLLKLTLVRMNQASIDVEPPEAKSGYYTWVSTTAVDAPGSPFAIVTWKLVAFDSSLVNPLR